MREGVGQLLAELMRIKGEGDYAAIKALVDKYGVHFDPAVRDQVIRSLCRAEYPDLLGGREHAADRDALARRRRHLRQISYPRDAVGQYLEYGQMYNTGLMLIRSQHRRGTMIAPAAEGIETRPYLLERVEDAAVVQLYADGFEALPLDQKILIYHLYEAALAGRDIFYDQRYAHNLEMREVLEEILTHANGIDPATLDAIHRYTKLFWINTGPHNNLTARKFLLKCSPAAFAAAAATAQQNGATFPLQPASRSTGCSDACSPCSSMPRSIPSSRTRRPAMAATSCRRARTISTRESRWRIWMGSPRATR